MPRDLQIAVRDNAPVQRNDILLRANKVGLDAYLNDTNQDYYEQKVFIELRFFSGEWFLDIDKGVPYYENIFVKAPDFAEVDSILQGTILDTDGISSLISFDSNYIPQLRNYNVIFDAKTIDDEIINYNVEL